MTVYDRLWVQVKELFPGWIVLYAVTVVFLGVMAIISSNTDIPMYMFTRDPIAALEGPLYVGLVSNVGILLWIATGAICLFSFWVLRDNFNDQFHFLLFSGLFTIVLCLDDLYQVHEMVLPEYIGIPQKVVFLGYGVTTLLYLLKFKSVIQKTNYFVFLVALLMFSISVAVDQIPKSVLANPHLIEDGAKLLGIVSWFIYLTQTCRRRFERNIVGDFRYRLNKW